MAARKLAQKVAKKPRAKGSIKTVKRDRQTADVTAETTQVDGRAPNDDPHAGKRISSERLVAQADRWKINCGFCGKTNMIATSEAEKNKIVQEHEKHIPQG